MKRIISVDAGGAAGALMLNTDQLNRLFGLNGKAFNINSMKVSPNALGTAVDYSVLADPDEQDEVWTSVEVLNIITADISGLADVEEIVIAAPTPGHHALFRFTTADVGPQKDSFSSFPVFNSLVMAWSVDLDFVIDFDFTVSELNLDMREEFMELLRNKTQVEDPNIDATVGKRKLVRAPMTLAEN